MSLPKVNFSLSKVKDLYDNGQLKDHIDCKNYVSSYLYPLNNGDHAYYDVANNEIKIISDDVLRKTRLNRMPLKIKKWYLTERVDMYDLVCELNKPAVYDDKINIVGKMMHQDADKKYSDYDDETKECVERMLSFFKSIWANDDDAMYEYLLNWMSNMVKGNKNSSLLYLKSGMEGIGKSTGTDFLMTHVVGQQLSIESNSEPLKTKYTKILFGKLLVVFEELERSSANEWETISKKLKQWITSKSAVYEEKFQKAITARNINNYIINTNREALKNADGRRYVILDLSTKLKGNKVYWDKLYETRFNDKVGEAFYRFLLERDTHKFDSQRFPVTLAKSESIADRLNAVYKTLKFAYIYKDKSLKCTTGELFEKYKQYCEENDMKAVYTKRKMIGILREVGINWKSSNGKTRYSVSKEALKEIAIKFNWLDVHDQDDIDDTCDMIGMLLISKNLQTSTKKL